MEDVASFITTNLVLSSPSYIIFLIGFILCARRWHRHPRISIVLAFGLFSLTTASLLANIGMPLADYFVRTRGGTPAEATIAVGIVRALVAVPYAIGFALMLYAVLAERPSRRLPVGR